MNFLKAVRKMLRVEELAMIKVDSSWITDQKA